MSAGVELALGQPPVEVSAGVGVHGSTGLSEAFRLPSLWQLHLYGYAGAIEVSGSAYPIRPGRLSLVPPGVEVRFHYGARRCEHLYAHFRLPGLGERRTVPVIRDTGAAVAALTVAMRRTIAATAQSPARASAELWTVLWQAVELRDGTAGAVGSRHPALRVAQTYVEERLASPLTVPDVARAAGVSHTHLTRLFRAGTGETVVGYIRRRRMERARHLLQASTLAIPAIAARVGVPDLQAFNKACRKELGASPRAVRVAAGTGPERLSSATRHPGH